MLFELIVRFTEIRERRGESKRLSGSGGNRQKPLQVPALLGPTSPIVRWVRGAHSAGVKRPRRPDH